MATKATKRLIGIDNTARYRLRNSYAFKGNQQNYNNVGAFNYGAVDFSVAQNTVSFSFGAGQRSGGVLLPNGRIFILSGNGTSQLYDPVLNTTKTIGTISNAYGGVLMQDGRVFCIPFGITTAYIFDPKTEAITTLGGFGSGFRGGVLLQDGRVFCCPFNRTSAIIYNPLDGTSQTVEGFRSQNFSFGCVLMQDGRVLRFATDIAEIYNPFTNSVSDAGGTFGIHYGGVLLPNGRIYCTAPGGTSRIYNPVTNTTIAASGSLGSGEAHAGACLTQDGKVFIPNLGAVAPLLYDPILDTLTTLAPAGSGATKFLGSVQLPNGQVLMIPFNNNATTGILYGNPSSKKLPMGRTHSPYWNKL